MNRLKLAYKSFAYSWNLIFESSKFMIFSVFRIDVDYNVFSVVVCIFAEIRFGCIDSVNT